jgi:hypothetical protein
VLRDIGYSDAEIEALSRSGATFDPAIDSRQET